MAVLPDNIKALSKARRAQWQAIVARQTAAGKSEADAIQFANANVLGKAAPATEEDDKQASEWTAAQVNELPDSSFLWVGPGGTKEEGKTTPLSLRKLPVKDSAGKVDLAHVRNALARIPDSDIPEAEKAGLTKKAQALLDAAKEAGDPGVSDVHVDAPIGAVKPVKKGKSVTYLMHLVQQMKGQFSDEDFSAMVAKARAHAGGKGKAARAASDWDTDDPDDDDGPEVLFEKSDERVNYRTASSAVERCGMCAFFDDDDDADNVNGPCCDLVEGVIDQNNVCSLFMPCPPAMAAEDSLTFITGAVDNALQNSFMINGGQFGVGLVSTFYYSQEIFSDYVIAQSRVDSFLYKIPFTYSAADGVKFGEPVKVKQEYVTASEVLDLCANGKLFRLFNEVQFADPPDWIPYLPKPGEYKHPKYGSIKITKARNKNFVTQFKDGIYQKQLPVDTEHQLSLSGAVGWINDMRVNSDGSADAKVDWTDRGKTLIEGDQYKYFSPAWFDKWTDPATSKDYKDIAIGGAITVRPFFKEGSLRPLVANEQGLFAHEYTLTHTGSKTEQFYFSAFQPINSTGDKAMPEQQNDDQKPLGMTEEQAKKFNELESKFTETEKRAAELEVTVKTLNEEKAKSDATVKTLSEKMEAQEKQARTERFTNEVKGRSDGGRPWIGKHEDHVKFMEDIAEKFGEDSDLLKSYITQNRTHSEQLESAGMFSEHGSGATANNSNSAMSRMEAKAAELRKIKPNLTAEQAIAEVMMADPKLYSEYEAEAGRQV